MIAVARTETRSVARVPLQAGGLAEGVVSSLGLLHTTLAQGGDFVMVLAAVADASA